MNKLIAGFILGVTLIACEQSGTVFPTAPDAGPGVVEIDPTEAGKIFARACILTQPDFSSVKNGLSDEFTQNSTTGTYYHNNADLSVKVHNGQCSMAFVSSKPVDEVTSKLAQGTLAITADIPPDIQITSTPYNGRRMFRMGLQR